MIQCRLNLLLARSQGNDGLSLVRDVVGGVCAFCASVCHWVIRLANYGRFGSEASCISIFKGGYANAPSFCLTLHSPPRPLPLFLS